MYCGLMKHDEWMDAHLLTSKRSAPLFFPLTNSGTLLQLLRVYFHKFYAIIAQLCTRVGIMDKDKQLQMLSKE